MLPDLDGNFTLITDASNTGLGAVLKQDNKVVAYASRSLNQSEKSYGRTEKEVLAALWRMEKFQYYLIGKTYALMTDHKAIIEIRKKDFGSARIQRWHHRLSRFNFKIN